MISDKLRWDSHVNYMLKKAYKKIWLLRRLKLLKLDSDILLDFYCKEVRSVLEFGAPVWHSGLTKCQTKLRESRKFAFNLYLATVNLEFHTQLDVHCSVLNPLKSGAWNSANLLFSEHHQTHSTLICLSRTLALSIQGITNHCIENTTIETQDFIRALCVS